MITIGVCDNDGGGLAERLTALKIDDCSIEKASRYKSYDLLVLKRCGEDIKGARAKYAVLLGGASIDSTVGVDFALSCGEKETDTLTPSSFLSHGGVASLQRRLISYNGKTVEPCEIELGAKGTLDEKLAETAVRLILDLI